MSTPSTTRRAALKALTGAAAYGAGVTTISVGAIVATATNSAKAATTQAVSPELARLIAEYRATDAQFNRFYATMFNPCVDREHELTARVPHVTVTLPACEGRARPISLTTASTSDVAQCKGIVSIPRNRQSQSPAWQGKYNAAQRIVAGVKHRADALARIRKETGVDEADRLEDEWIARVNAIASQIAGFPAHNVHDLAAKFAFQRESGGDDDVIADMVAADLDRLTKREA